MCLISTFCRPCRSMSTRSLLSVFGVGQEELVPPVEGSKRIEHDRDRGASTLVCLRASRAGSS